MTAETLRALTSWQKRSALAGAVGLSLCLVGALVSPGQLLRSYLVGFLFWLGVPLGCLALLLLHHLVGGNWGFVSRRSFEAASRTLPVLAGFFLPILLGLRELYPWAAAGAVEADPALQHKAVYLNRGSFLLRAGVFFAIWVLLALFVNRYSREQDKGERAWLGRLQLVGALGLLLYGLTITFAAVDWVMSLEPHWFSTVYGLLFMVGQVLSGLAFVVVVLALLSRFEPLSRRLQPAHFHDLGNLILAFVLLWAYLAFSQYLIIWSGNLPEEIPWYVHRLDGGWQWLGLILIVFHFAVPFLVLLSRTVKRQAQTLVKVAVALLVFRVVDLFWLAAPAFSPGALRVHWLDLAAPLAIGGFWLSVFFWQLKALPLLPLNDPRFAGALEPREAMEHGAG
jgi:hypothetical protein